MNTSAVGQTGDTSLRVPRDRCPTAGESHCMRMQKRRCGCGRDGAVIKKVRFVTVSQSPDCDETGTGADEPNEPASDAGSANTEPMTDVDAHGQGDLA